MNQRQIIYLLLFCVSLFATNRLKAQQVDSQLLNSLNLEANHDLNRLKSLKAERHDKKVYDNEREKGLGSFLEEQEKWDLLREKGLAEYRKQKKSESPRENGPEHQQDIKEKKQVSQQMEKNRQILVKTKQQVFSKNKDLIQSLESDELGLNHPRPRYDLRKRGHNKWNKNGPATKTTSSPGYNPPPPTGGANFDDFPPPPPPVPDFQGMPMPSEGFEEIPPPPPPVYESYGNPPGGTGYDPAFGDFPPPPPPPPDFDF